MSVVFQRKVATRFNTEIEGNKFRAVHYGNKGIYGDALFLMVPELAKDYHTDGSLVGLKDLFPKKNFGFVVGYKSVVSTGIKGPSIRFKVEAGLHPGYFPDAKSRLIVRFGAGVGIGKKK